MQEMPKEVDRHDPECLRGAVIGVVYWASEEPAVTAVIALRRGRRSP